LYVQTRGGEPWNEALWDLSVGMIDGNGLPGFLELGAMQHASKYLLALE